MTQAPDFVEAVIGYRAWHVEEDGVLRPWTFSALPWEPGVNRAVCARDVRHAPPVAECMCGLYALTDPGDRRLDFRADQAVGAIAAWGDLEVHRTGFRAEQACVVALALPERADVDQRARLERAAERYGVALVPASELSAEARRHGAPLPEELWEPAWPGAARGSGFAGVRSVPAVPPIEPAAFGGASRGIALDAHLWVETALGAVVVGVTSALGKRLGGDGLEVVLPEPGDAVEAGDRVATIVAGGSSFAVWAPVGGAVLAVNPRVVEDPSLLGRDPEGGGWLLRMVPRDWERDARGVTWGAAANRHYAACLARDDARRGDAFADVRLERLRALPPVRSAGDVLALLRSEREALRFADADAVGVELGGRLRDALAADPSLRAHLGRLDAVVRFELAEPEASVVLDLRGGGAAVRCGCRDGADGDVVLRCTAETAYDWFTGSLDAAGAVRRGELLPGDGTPVSAALRALAVLKHLRVPGWTPAPIWVR